VTLALAAVLAFAFPLSIASAPGAPDITRLKSYTAGGATLLLDREGEPFADLAPVEREVVPLESLPAYVPEAFIAIEDKRFRKHAGVDLFRVIGAALRNLRAGSVTEGSSTISMQLARNVFPDRIRAKERTLKRKLLEMWVALQIEREFDKDEILELYLNHIYFGNGASGIAAASHHYFRGPPSALTLPQAALLAALLKAPSHYDPRRHPEAATERRNLVIERMEEQERIGHVEAEAARRAPLSVTRHPGRVSRGAFPAPYFTEEVRRQLEEMFGDRIYADPVRVWTTIDTSLQRAAEEELERQLVAVERGELGHFRGPRYSAEAPAPEEGTPYLQGAVLALDVKSGDVLAWVGGRDILHSRFDRVSLGQRQMGSAFKPFVYAAALERGTMLSERLIDEPLTVDLPGDKVWEPHNFDESYDGEVTVRDALVRSKNVATVRLAQEIGLEPIIATAKRAGIVAAIEKHPSTPLGTPAVSPLELTSAYTIFASLGRRTEPRMITRVEARDGRLLWEAGGRNGPRTGDRSATRDGSRGGNVIDPAVAYLIDDVLSEALARGSGAPARAAGFRGAAAGKTGTTNDGVDAWFIGFTPELVTGVWIGFDEPRPIVPNASGGRVAAPVWGRMMARHYRGRQSPPPWKAPGNIVAHEIDPGSGLVLEEGCWPLEGQPYRELFIAGREPRSICPDDMWAYGADSSGYYGYGDDAYGDDTSRAGGYGPRGAARYDAWRRSDSLAYAWSLDDEARRSDRDDAYADERSQHADEYERNAARVGGDVPPDDDGTGDADDPASRRVVVETIVRGGPGGSQRFGTVADSASGRDAQPHAHSDDETESRASSAVASESSTDLSGWWEITHQGVTDPSGAQRVAYRVYIRQEGDELRGDGNRWMEDGARVSLEGRNAISIFGRIDGEMVRLRYTEQTGRQSAQGEIRWSLSSGRTLSGSFSQGAKSGSGVSTARRIP
jgi:1A family penicillin-binding protein